MARRACLVSASPTAKGAGFRLAMWPSSPSARNKSTPRSVQARLRAPSSWTVLPSSEIA